MLSLNSPFIALYAIIHFHLWSLISTFAAPTPAATSPSPAIVLDPAIWAALIGLMGVLIASGLAFYQFRRTAQLEKKRQAEQLRHEEERQKDQFRHEEEMERLRTALEKKTRAEEHQEQEEEHKAEAVRLKMVLAQTTTERATAYRQSLKADSRIVGIQILDMTRPLDVMHIYVKVRVHQEARTSYVLDPTIQAAEKRHDPNSLLQMSAKYLERRTSSAIDPEEALRTYKRCVFVGDPGAGKTTLLKYLTIRAAEHQLDKLPDVPIRIELNAFAASGYQDLLDFAAADWDERYGFPKADARMYMHEQLKAGSALLLLDALDETVVGETPEAADASYQRVAEAILHLASRYEKAPIVITARKAGYHQHASLVGFTELEVLDFRPEDIEQFITKWFDCYSDPQKQANGHDLIQKLEQNPRMQALAANPLLLSLIVLVYEAQLDLPERRSELYKRCVDVLLTEWDAKRNIRRRREFKPEHKRQLLAQIAWHFHLQGKRYFPERELLNVIADFLPKVRLQPEHNGLVLAEIANEHGLLKEQARGWQGFLHLTLQEYFVAQYLTDHHDLEPLLAHLGDPWWEEVLLLYAGYAPDASPLLNALLGKDGKELVQDDIFSTNLILAGRCLAARPTLQQADLWDIVVEKLFELLLTTSYTLIREHAAEDLVALRDNKVNQRLLRMLPDEQVHRNARWYIASALGELGDYSIAPDLLHMLPDAQIEWVVRTSIARALGDLGDHSIVPDLLGILPDENINVNVRENIATTLGELGDHSIMPDLLHMLSDTQIDWVVRAGIAKALGELGDHSIVPDLLHMLPDEHMDGYIRGRLIDALGELGDHSIVPDLLHMLPDEHMDGHVRWSITNVLGELGDHSIVPDLLHMLPNEHIKENVREGIATALGELGDHSIVPDLLRMLPDKHMDRVVRAGIARALGMLGEHSIVSDLLSMLPDAQIGAALRWRIAETLGELGDHSAVPDLLRMLPDKQMDESLRRRIISALENLIQDENDVSALAALLPSSDDIANEVHRALWTTSRRVGVRIYMIDGPQGKQPKIVEW